MTTAALPRRERRRPVTAQMRQIVERAREAASSFDNRFFGEMYAYAVERKAYYDDDTLLRFMKHLEQPPVDIETFIDSAEFLGATDLKLWPEVRRAVVEINKDWWKGPRHAIFEAVLAGATGCVDRQTEFLTPTGWKSIDQYTPGDLVAQYHADGHIDFVLPEYVKLPYGAFFAFKTRSFDQLLTPGHRVIYRSPKTGAIKEIAAEELVARHNKSKLGWDGQFIGDYRGGGEGIALTDAEIRLMVAVMADGCFSGNAQRLGRPNYCVFHLKRDDKIHRLRRLLRDARIFANEYARDDGYIDIAFLAPQANKTYEGWWAASYEQLQLIADEVLHWDGTEGRDEYYTRDKPSADFIQHAFNATGRRATLNPFVREDGSVDYVVHVVKNATWTILSSSRQDIGLVPSEDGFAYCFTLPTGMWLSRRNGKVVVTGNTGKSEISKVTLLYHLHILFCLRVPQEVYGLPKTTSICFAIQAAKPHVTKKVLYLPMRKMVEDMPFFQKHARLNKLIESEMYFEDKNIRVVPGGSDSDSILGEAIIGGIIDEINFMNIVLKSKKAEVSTGRAGVFDQAQSIHDAMTKRKKGRFTYQGPQIGVICSSSSTRFKGDFTDKRIEQVKRFGEKNVYVYRKAQYEVTPQERYCGESFRLLVGNDVLQDTRVLGADEQVPDGSLILNVPIEYREDFLRDPHGSLRDVCGISTSSISPFFRRRFKIVECVQAGHEAGLESFLTNDNVILGREGLPLVRKEHYCQNPSRPRYVHVDLSVSGDRCVAEGQRVLMGDGLYLPIEDVRPGDNVISHDGTERVVVATHRNGSKPVLSVYVYGWADPLRATDNHRVWALRRSRVSYRDGRLVKPSDPVFYGRQQRAAKERYNYVPEFAELGTLRPGDFLVAPRPVQAHYEEMQGVALSYEAGYIAGLFAAEGSFYFYRDSEYVQFSLHQDETRILQQLSRCLHSEFGLTIRTHKDRRGKGMTVRTPKCPALVDFLYGTVGEKSSAKHMQAWRYGNPHFHAGLCHGYVDGDGYVRYDQSGAPVAFKTKTVSRAMAESFYWLLVANGFVATLAQTEGYTSEHKGRRSIRSPCYSVSVSGKAQMGKFARWGEGHVEVPCSQAMALPGYVLLPIQSIEDGGRAPVYDLTVADTSSYIVGTTAVHNCGVAMVRYDGMMQIERASGIIEKLPVCTVEMALSIEPDANNEIDPAEIRTWIKVLRDQYGYPIKVVTYDGFQSKESMQQWKKQGMKTGLVTVDRTSTPYKSLRDAINDGRVALLDQPVLIQELFDLEYDEVKDKVDHPVSGSKDVADAVCGAFITMVQRRASWIDAAGDDEKSTVDDRMEYEARHEADRAH